MKKIKIVSPAKAIAQSKIDNAVQFLSGAGFEVSVSEHASGKFHYFSATDDVRLTEFQSALDDFEIDVILCSRGGYGTVRIIDKLDFSKFEKSPKLILGFSDVTVFHNHIHRNFGLPTVHCSVPLNFEDNSEEAMNSMVNVLNGKPNEYILPSHRFNRSGTAEAVVVGGNLSILASLIGTNSDIDTAGKILLIEDIGEPVYKIDRMLWSLKKSGKLNKLAGLIVGGMTDMKDSDPPFGKSVEEVIVDIVSEFDYPVCFDFPAGHIDDNRGVVLGRMAKLVVGEEVEFLQE